MPSIADHINDPNFQIKPSRGAKSSQPAQPAPPATGPSGVPATLIDVGVYRQMPSIAKTYTVGKNMNLTVCPSSHPGHKYFSVYGANDAELLALLNLVKFALGLPCTP